MLQDYVDDNLMVDDLRRIAHEPEHMQMSITSEEMVVSEKNVQGEKEGQNA